MFRKSLALIPVLAVLLFSFSLRAYAQTYHAVSQVGTVNGSMDISVVSNSWDTGLANVPIQINGTVDISGFSGILGVSVSASVSTMVSDTTKINGRTYKRSRIATNPFLYLDLNTFQQRVAIMQATVINYAHGTLVFQIVDTETGVTLAATGTPDGQLTPLALTSGNTTIN